MKKALLWLLLLLSICVFPALILKDGVVYHVEDIFQDGEYYFRVDDLSPLGFRYVSAEGVYYVIVHDHVFYIHDDKIVKDFLEELSEKAIKRKGDLFLPASIVTNHTDFALYKTPDGVPIFSDRIPMLMSVKKYFDKIEINYGGTIVPEMVKTISETGKLRIIISPVLKAPPVSEDAVVSFDGNKITLDIDIGPNRFPMIDTQYEKSKLIFKMTFVKGFFGEQKLADGVVWERRMEGFKGEKLIVNYLHVDLSKARISPVLSAGGIGSLEKIDDMAKRVGALAGVNANYFDPGTGMLIGLLIINGKILSNIYSNRPVFIISEDGSAYIRRITFEVDAQMKDTLFLVKGVNTLAKGEVLLFTEEFGRKIPKENDKIYVLVKDGVVIDKEYKENLGKGEMLFSISKKYKNYIDDLQKGDRVSVILNTDFPLPIKHAVEGGPLLLLNGSPIPDASLEKKRYGGGIALSRAPRTIAAIKDKKLSFIVIEGYNDFSRGLNYDEMVDFLLSKGYEHAMCFDGGSSASMVIRGEIVNTTYKSEAPSVPVGLMVWGESEH